MKKTNYTYSFVRQLSYLLTIGIEVGRSFFWVETLTAAEWRLEPELRVGYEFDDNATLAVFPGSSD